MAAGDLEDLVRDARGHLDDDVLADYFFGRLSFDDAAKAARHLLVCADGSCVRELAMHAGMREQIGEMLGMDPASQLLDEALLVIDEARVLDSGAERVKLASRFRSAIDSFRGQWTELVPRLDEAQRNVLLSLVPWPLNRLPSYVTASGMEEAGPPWVGHLPAVGDPPVAMSIWARRTLNELALMLVIDEESEPEALPTEVRGYLVVEPDAAHHVVFRKVPGAGKYRTVLISVARDAPAGELHLAWLFDAPS